MGLHLTDVVTQELEPGEQLLEFALDSRPFRLPRLARLFASAVGESLGVGPGGVDQRFRFVDRR